MLLLLFKPLLDMMSHKEKKPMQAVFVSDIHLTEASESRYKSFVEMLLRLQKNPPENLVLLGDIFDLWVGKHKYFIEKHAELLQILGSFKATGCQVHYFEGNHDLYLQDFFGDKLGFAVHPNELEVEWAGIKIRMEHGDLANPEDKGYLFLRSFLRNPLTRFVIRNLPGSSVNKIGESASHKSRDYTSGLNVDSRNIVREYCKRLAKKSDFEVLITGHTHIKDDFVFEFESRKLRNINLGSWFEEIPQCLVLENDQLIFKDIDKI